MLAVSLAAFSPALPRNSSLGNPRFDSVVTAAMNQCFQMEYAKAESLLARIPDDNPMRPYFTGLICLNRFQDLGDTASLRRGEQLWEELSPRDPSSKCFKEDSLQLHAYQGLAEMQLSYLAALRGSRMRSASLALSAHGKLRSVSGVAEADAGLALFEYYRERVLQKIDFLPFVNPDPDAALHRLETAAKASLHLHDILRVSVFWIRLDRGEMDSALKISDEFLGRYPRNRLARQMRGSALFHAGRFSEARNIYEQVSGEYAVVRDSLPFNIPLGYFKAVGNLARIYAQLGMQAEAAARLSEWKKALDSGISPWLPASLKRDLKRLENH